MAKEVYVSKAFAVIVVTLTVSAIAAIITMVIVYQNEIAKLNPTPRPTRPAPTTLPTGPPPNMRLPGNLVPKSYELYFQVHLFPTINSSDVNATDQMFTFTGNSTVVFQCVRKTKSIFLHSNNLTLLELSVRDWDTGERLPHSNYVEYHDGTNFLEVPMAEALAEGRNYSLYVDFLGMTQDDMVGVYVSSYEEDGLTKCIITTQLEPTDARKVFPCFDEPALKATFNVTIIHRRDTTALGNWEQLDSGLIDDDWQYTSFFPTKRMSTYLLAFAVSQFPYTSDVSSRVTIKTYARKEAIEAGQVDYSTKVTGKLLKFFEEYFDINYPLQKLDQFVVTDHRAAAMENWGLIVYEESGMLFDEGASELHKEWIVDVVAHELAHQWFGNLVTMSWWNDVWLNEGFSTYMSNLGMEHAEPTWNIREMKEMSQRLSVFEIDSLNSSHPLSPPADDIQTSFQIGNMFSSISYYKGGVVLRMLADLLTEPVFHAGIKMYLKKFEFKNTVTQDVWDCMQKALDEAGGNINVAEVMNTWTQQTGYPVITINTTNGEIYQKQFTLNQSTVSSRVWHIPIRVMSETSKPTFVLLDTDSPVKKDAFISKEGEWVLANINASGYFRVNYNPENWRSLMNQLEKSPAAIPVMNRAQLIDDVFNLVRAKLVNVTLALNITRFLRNDTAYMPWDAAITNLNYFVAMLDRSIVNGPMQAYMRKLVTPLYIHFQNYTDNCSIPQDFSEQPNQLHAIQLACSNELPECQTMAINLFRHWIMNGTNRIHPNLRFVIYCQGVAAGGDSEWEFVWRMYQNSSIIPPEKDNLGHALTCTNRIWQLNRLLDYCLDLDMIPNMDVLEIIGHVAANPVGQALAWNFVRAHWTFFIENYRPSLTHVLLTVTKRFSTDFELQELKQFQVAHNASENMVMNQAIERTRANIEWVKENKQPVLEWFWTESNFGG